MAEIVLILGGNSSGKTRLALFLATETPRLYIATGRITDHEMLTKIRAHRKERRGWDTLISPVLEPEDIKLAISSRNYRNAVIDCVGFFITNCMAKGINPEVRIEEALKAMASIEKVIVVSNEVGLGLVAPNPLARSFSQRLGHINQILADKAGTVYFITSGQAITIKGPQPKPPQV